jgi:transglutaminase-like putative cysteine protease
MEKSLYCLLIFCLMAAVGLPVQNAGKGGILDQARSLEDKGEFRKATDFIRQHLATAKDLTPDQREELEFEIERVARIRQDYDLTREDLLESLKKRIKDFQPEELKKWEEGGRLDMLRIDGTNYYAGPSVSNLFYRYPDIRARRIEKPTGDEKFAKAAWENYVKLTEMAKKSPDPLLDPQTFRVTMTVTVKENAVTEGKTIRCWLPYPRACPSQTDIQFLSSEPELKWLDQPQSLMRSAYVEQPAKPEKPTVFRMTYQYRTFSRCFNIDPARVLPYDTADLEYGEYTREKPPHVVFLPEFKALSEKILGDEANPYLKAKKIYEWIAHNIVYSYAREYSTLLNISKYTYDHRYGDCGQEALLFITLCRMNGIPARWESGWVAYPGWKGMHDWTQIYIRPYGWIPVDPYMGIFTVSMDETLTPKQRASLRDFYFGNMDHFRLIANNDHSVPLFPPKRSFRSDTVDFQRGELEADGKNIYYDKFSYKMEFEPLGESDVE